MVFILGLLSLPVAGTIAAKIVHAGMAARYVLPAALGAAVAVGHVVNRAPAALRTAFFGLLLLSFNCELFLANGVLKTAPFGITDQTDSVARQIETIARGQDPRFPIVVSSGLQYVPMFYYASAAIRARLHALADPEAAVKFAGTDSVDVGLLALRRYFPVQVAPYKDFAGQYPEFLLVSNSGMFDWWPDRFVAEGHTLQLVAVSGQDKIYHVKLKL